MMVDDAVNQLPLLAASCTLPLLLLVSKSLCMPSGQFAAHRQHEEESSCINKAAGSERGECTYAERRTRCSCHNLTSRRHRCDRNAEQAVATETQRARVRCLLPVARRAGIQQEAVLVAARCPTAHNTISIRWQRSAMAHSWTARRRSTASTCLPCARRQMAARERFNCKRSVLQREEPVLPPVQN